jgi:hypothetical protein
MIKHKSIPNLSILVYIVKYIHGENKMSEQSRDL